VDWAAWLESLADADRRKAEALRDRFAELGAEDPEGWAKSEIVEDIAQQARFVFLRSLWREAIDGWAAGLERLPSGRRLLEGGAERSDLEKLARVAAYEAVFTVLNRLDEGHDPDAPVDSPGWSLLERAGDDLTGRPVDGLHESILTLDPSGREGADLYR